MGDRGVDARPDAEVVAVAAADQRVIATAPTDSHVRLGEPLDTWVMAYPELYGGLHWPP